jgi:SpoVK/Ycf46/Vps4 family AAA+-type ATPase
MELDRLIKTLHRGIDNHVPYLEGIRYPDKLVEALEDLRDVVGNSGAKDAIAGKVLSHLVRRYMHRQDSTLGDPPFMSNLILGGEPGTGKTHLAHKIAKIISYLDFFEHLYSPSPPSSSSQSKAVSLPIEEEMGSYDIITSSQFYVAVLVALVAIVAICGTFFIQLSKILSGQTMLILIGVLILLVALVIFMVMYQMKRSFSSFDINTMLNEAIASSKKTTLPVIPGEAPVVIIKRNDLVGQYSGWTQKKTLEKLAESRGCVLFFDEAYQLVTDPRDGFGKEILVAINQYMSEHPNDIYFIFAGYVDLIESELFSVQPGLRSRFSVVINCGDYSPHDLMTIFLGQLKHEGRQYVDKVDLLLDFFEEYHATFTAYGRDTLRLVEYSIQDRDIELMRNSSINLKQIELDNIERGYDRFMANQLAKPPATKSREQQRITELLSTMMQSQTPA